MNGKERIRTVMEGGVPDRVPVWAQLSIGHLTRNTRLTDVESPTVLQLAAAERELHARYGFDGIAVATAIPNVPFAAGQPWGGWPDSARGELRELGDVDPTGWPELETSVTDEWAEPYDLARHQLGASLHVCGWLLDSFSLAAVWCGSIQQSLLAMIDHPERFARLVTYLDQLNFATARALARRAKVDSIGISSPFAGSTFISREQYVSYVAPSIARIAAVVREEGAFSFIHTCGFTNDRLELEADTGVTGIECMDPAPLGNVDLADAKRRVGQRVFLKGNLDSVNVLLRGSDAEVEREMVREIEVGKVGGRYILSSACSVAPEVPPERIHLMVKMAEKHGRC
jgi:uroporphyrinogen-III decarboxylase